MKKLLTVLFLLISALSTFAVCSADVDPILIDKPSPIVFECGDDYFLEIPNGAVIEYSLGGRRADDYYLFISTEFLFLGETTWKGMDKSSFVLKHSVSGSGEETYPLNYAMTSMMSMRSGWKTLSDSLTFATLVPMYLVFDIPTNNRQGWSLIFQPAERGGTAVCEVEIPLRIQ